MSIVTENESKLHDFDTIVESINNISRQTNLLVLNASIEAARVREQD